MPFGAGAAGASRPKSLYPSRLRPKVYAPRTDAVFDKPSKVGYNGVMKKDDSMSDGEIRKTLDMIFEAGFEFGKANLMNAKESLALFKMTMKNDVLREQCFKALDEGIARTNRLDTADRKKNAESN